MGMMLMIILLFATASVVLEIVLVHKVPVLKWLAHKYIVAGIIMSLAISAGLGVLFGATGMVAMVAGVLSTVVSEPIHYINAARARGKNKIDRWINEAIATFRPLWRLIKICGWILLLPITLPIQTRRYCLAYKSIQLRSGHSKALLALTGPDFWTENFMR